jgi:hypothetical protein
MVRRVDNEMDDRERVAPAPTGRQFKCPDAQPLPDVVDARHAPELAGPVPLSAWLA